MIVAALQIPGLESMCPPAPVTSTEQIACAVASWSAPAQIALLVVVILLLAIVVYLGRIGYRRWMGSPRGPYPDQRTVPIVFPARQAPPGAADGGGRSEAPAPYRGRSPEDERTPEAEDQSSEMIGSRHGPPEKPSRPSTVPSTTVAEAESEVEADDASEAAKERSPEDEATREQDDRTLQLLPGRLEVVAGGTQGREIRFVRTPDNTYTFGRNPGSDQTHFQLNNPTVSREHATMRYVNGRWRIRNRSSTNPLTINGVLASTPGKEYTLSDGDRIEMGEVAFLFRKK